MTMTLKEALERCKGEYIGKLNNAYGYSDQRVPPTLEELNSMPPYVREALLCWMLEQNRNTKREKANGPKIRITTERTHQTIKTYLIPEEVLSGDLRQFSAEGLTLEVEDGKKKALPGDIESFFALDEEEQCLWLEAMEYHKKAGEGDSRLVGVGESSYTRITEIGRKAGGHG